jgi:DNA-binding XRE family transcriptional regulator
VKIKLKDNDAFNELLIRKGLTKSGLAAAIEMSVPMTIQISNGDRGPGPKTAKRITEVLKVDFDEIFKIEKPEKSTAV